MPNRDITKTGQDILKLLVPARSIKGVLWLEITRYQDEINPFRESRRRGGGGKVLLGTKKFEKIKKSTDKRGHPIYACIDSFNAAVRQIQALPCPAWLSENCMPTIIDRSTVFTHDIDAAMRSDVTLGTAWAQLWKNDPERTLAPAWVADPNVRLGIRHKLLLDRIEEERKRLDNEVNNIEGWLQRSVGAAWRCLKTAQSSVPGERSQEQADVGLQSLLPPLHAVDSPEEYNDDLGDMSDQICDVNSEDEEDLAIVGQAVEAETFNASWGLGGLFTMDMGLGAESNRIQGEN
ncbi:hypothetical protein FRB97_001815 [Tulasnella sp. 331]|nr:hypothetical protein FRB97_001815 [Tulasnella sp. 331]KAG8870108.1 hypothetical protein FRB98_001842 [Tulasnella sp. 332]